MKKILFTGGGSGGHVTLNLGLIPLFQQAGWEVIYIGSKTGIENELIKKLKDVRYYTIETGKLRRYFSIENFKDALRIPLGIFQAWKIIHKEKPDVIFSKGGFVSFPVVLGGYLNGCRKIYPGTCQQDVITVRQYLFYYLFRYVRICKQQIKNQICRSGVDRPLGKRRYRKSA